MKPQVLLIHGFNVKDGGKKSIGELGPYFTNRDCDVHMRKYGHFTITEARLKNDDVAKQVEQFVKNSVEPVILVGHSNGCNIIYLAMKLFKAEPAHTVFINPALKRDIRMPPSCKSLDIWHSPSDKPVKWARFLWKSKYLNWGAMGTYGPSYEDPRINSYNKEEMLPSSKTHSDMFHTENISFYGPKVADASLRRIVR